MGTRFELVLAGDGGDEARLRAAGEEALFEIEEAERRLSLFRKDSLLAHLNRSGAARPVRVDADTWDLLVLCDELARATGGAFDPTVAPLMRAWGLHGADSCAPRVDRGGALRLVGWDAVELDPAHRAVRLRVPGATLDLGGVAKGHGLDLAAARLREAGVERALLHGGTSTAIAIGAPPGARAWRVAVAPGPAAPVAELRDAALSVSAPEGRVAHGPDGRATHVLDPRTGGPACAGVTRAAAVAASAALADAWSTALLVSGGALPARADVESLWAAGDGAAPRWHHRVADGAPSIRIPSPIHDA